MDNSLSHTAVNICVVANIYYVTFWNIPENLEA